MAIDSRDKMASAMQFANWLAFHPPAPVATLTDSDIRHIAHGYREFASEETTGPSTFTGTLARKVVVSRLGPAKVRTHHL